MRKNSFIKNGFLLTVINMIAQLIQLYLEIWYSKILGSQGIGLFQLMMSIYCLAMTLAMGGYSIAVTRLTSKNIELKGVKSARNAVKKTMLAALITSGFISVLLCTFAEYICLNRIKSSYMILPLQILALALPPMALSVCIDAYFITVGKIKTIGTITLFSRLVNVFFAYKFINMMSYSFTGKCTAITFSSLITEILSLLLSLIFFCFYDKTEKNPSHTPFKDVFSISMPICAGAALRSFLNMLQNMLIPWGFIKYGLSETEAMANYGIIKGMAIPVIVFPATLMSSFLALLIPEISKAYETGDKGKISRAVIKSSSVTIIFSVALTGIYIFYGEELGRAIYGDYSAGKYIKILAPLTTFMFLDDVVDSTLKGMNEQIYSLKINVIESAVRVILLFILLPHTAVTGYVFVIFFGNILNFVMSYCRLSQIADVYIDIKNWLIKPILIITFCGYISKIIIPFKTCGLGVLVFSIISVMAVYILLCIKTGCFKNTGVKN